MTETDDRRTDAPSPTGPRSSRRAAVRIALGFLAAAGGLCAALGLSVANERAAILTQVDRRLANGAELAAAHVGRTLGDLGVFVTLFTARFADEALTLPRLADALLQAYAASARSMPEVRDVVVVDAAGVARFATEPRIVGARIADRPYFVAARRDPGRGAFINMPVASRAVPGRRVLPVSWPLARRDGSFAGVVVISLSPGYFARVFDSAAEGERGFVAVTDRAGAPFVMNGRRWPDGDAPAPRLDAFLAAVGGAAGRAVVSESLDGEDGPWRVAVASVPDTPLRVVSGALQAELLAPWRRHALVAFGVYAVMVAALAALTAALARHAGRQRRSARLAQEARATAEAAQRRAEAADRAKTDFLAAMSHEIRTPLTAVLGVAGLLDASDLAARERRHVAAIRAAGRQLLAVINDILDFTRLGSGRLPLERVDFAAAAALEEVTSAMTSEAIERGLTLEVRMLDPEPPIVRGDPTRLKQVLFNLVGNAIKFTRRGGVTVTVDRGDPSDEGERVSLRFEVRDTGAGIAPGQLPRLFQPFSQGDGSTTREYGGTGLGLAISKRLVELMGGRIGVESEPGAGSVFWFEIPFERGDPVAVVHRAALDPESVPPLRILVAEDVPLNQDLIREKLTRHGHEVTIVGNGREALAEAAARDYDVVLMDVQMPVMDGVEAVRRLRGLNGPRGAVPVVALTANVMERDRRRYLEAGMDACLIKPIDWTELFAVLAALTARDGVASRRTPDGPEVPAAPVAPAAAPALDADWLAPLERDLGPEAVTLFLKRAVEEAEEIGTRIARLSRSPAEAAREAHKLKGMALNLGLAGVGEAAAAIEAEGSSGGEAADLVAALAEAIGAARAEVEARGGPA